MFTFSARFEHPASQTQGPAPTLRLQQSEFSNDASVGRAASNLAPLLLVWWAPAGRADSSARTFYPGPSGGFLASTRTQVKRSNLGYNFGDATQCHCSCTSLPFDCVVANPSLFSAITNTSRAPFQRFTFTFPALTIPCSHHSLLPPFPAQAPQ